MDSQEAQDIRDRQIREPGGLDFTTVDYDKKFNQPSQPANWPDVQPATRRGPARPDVWRLHDVPDVAGQSDGSGIACLINWTATDVVRIDLIDLMNEVGTDGGRFIVSFQGKADNVRKHTMQWLAKYVPVFGLDHAAYIGAEIERADTERIDYVQDGGMRNTETETADAIDKALLAWLDAEKTGTHAEIIDSAQEAVYICSALIVERSAWFEVLPLPDDAWRITIKAENRKWLQQRLLRNPA